MLGRLEQGISKNRFIDASTKISPSMSSSLHIPIFFLLSDLFQKNAYLASNYLKVYLVSQVKIKCFTKCDFFVL